MPAFQIVLPVGAYGIVPGLPSFTRTGKDGAEVIVAVFAGDEFVGEVLEGLWQKTDDAVIHTPVTYITGSSLNMSGHAAVAGNEDRSWSNSKWPILANAGTEYDVHMELPGHSAANTFGFRFMVGATNNGVVDPDAAYDILDLQLYTTDAVYSILVRKKVANSWSDLLAATAVTNPEGMFRVRFHLDHIHIYYHDGAGTLVEADDELTGSPYTLSLPLVLWPSYMFWSTEATDRAVLSDYVRITYPNSLRVGYELAPANNLLGMCHTYDTMGTDVEANWREVYDCDHSFIGDCVLQNGLIRLWLDEANNQMLYYWTGATWAMMAGSILEVYLGVSAKALLYGSLTELLAVTSELCMVKLRLRDSVTLDDDYYVDIVVSLHRGQYALSLSFDSVYPGGQAVAVYILFDNNTRFTIPGNAPTNGIGDADLAVAGLNTTQTDNFLIGLDDAGAAVLGVLAGTHKPSNMVGYQGDYIAYETLHGADVLNATMVLGLVPFTQVANLFKEAESATLGGGADTEDLGDDSGNSARLNAQNEYVTWNFNGGVLALPVGRYKCLARVKDTAQVANDMKWRVYNADHATFMNQENANVFLTLSAGWVYHQLVFDVKATDIGDNCYVVVYKDTVDANTIYVDSFLLIPVGNGESWPQEVAHNAMRTTTFNRRIIRR